MAQLPPISHAWFRQGTEFDGASGTVDPSIHEPKIGDSTPQRRILLTLQKFQALNFRPKDGKKNDGFSLAGCETQWFFISKISETCDPPMMSPSTAGLRLGTHQFREFLFGLLVSQTFSVSTVTFPPDEGCMWETGPGVPKIDRLMIPSPYPEK